MSSATTKDPILPETIAVKLRELGERCGVRNIRVFGSFARGEAGGESDLDLLVDYVPGQSGFAFFRFRREAEELLGRKVDVATEEGLHSLIRDRILAEAVPL